MRGDFSRCPSSSEVGLCWVPCQDMICYDRLGWRKDLGPFSLTSRVHEHVCKVPCMWVGNTYITRWGGRMTGKEFVRAPRMQRTSQNVVH